VLLEALSVRLGENDDGVEPAVEIANQSLGLLRMGPEMEVFLSDRDRPCGGQLGEEEVDPGARPDEEAGSASQPPNELEVGPEAGLFGRPWIGKSTLSFALRRSRSFRSRRGTTLSRRSSIAVTLRPGGRSKNGSSRKRTRLRISTSCVGARYLARLWTVRIVPPMPQALERTNVIRVGSNSARRVAPRE
jgi:hypothetical protein